MHAMSIVLSSEQLLQTLNSVCSILGVKNKEKSVRHTCISSSSSSLTLAPRFSVQNNLSLAACLLKNMNILNKY